jgi:endoglucanase
VSSQFNDGRLIFELWNEPVISKADNGTSQWPTLKGYWQQLTDVIRGNGNNSMLLATGNQWAYNLKGIRNDPLPDANTAYSWHVYANSGHNDPAEWNASLDGLDKVKPVVVTEWGFDSNTTNHYSGTAESFGYKFRDNFLEARGLHSTGWCLNANYGPSLVQSDWTTPTCGAAFLADYLRNNSTVMPSQPVVDPAPLNLLSDPDLS